MQNKKVGKASAKRIMAMFYFALLILVFLLQTSVFPLLPFYYGSLPGMFYGLCAGLLMDLFYSGPFGFYSLIFVLIGYGNGYFHHYYYEEYITLPLFLCVVSGLIYHLYIYIFRFAVRGKGNIPYYALHIILPSIVFSFLLTVVLYRFFFSASKKLEEKVL